MNRSMEFKKFHNKILVHMKTYDATIDFILVHFVSSKLGLYVSFRIPLYLLLPAELYVPRYFSSGKSLRILRAIFSCSVIIPIMAHSPTAGSKDDFRLHLLLHV